MPSIKISTIGINAQNAEYTYTPPVPADVTFDGDADVTFGGDADVTFGVE